MVENLSDDKLRELEDRLQRLEQWTGMAEWKPTPGFDPVKFHRIFLRYFLVYFLTVFLVALAGGGLAAGAGMVMKTRAPQTEVLGLPLVAEPFVGKDYPVSVFGLPVGIIGVQTIGLLSVGGLGIGVVAIGGGALGLIAIGGGAIGVISFGGGSLGVISFGGGAVGYIAIGGGAYGKYVLAGDGKGRYVFDRKRQDPEAVELFCRWFPRLRQAFIEEQPA